MRVNNIFYLHVNNIFYFIKERGAWVTQLGKRLTSDQFVILQLVSLNPTSGSVLTAQSLEQLQVLRCPLFPPLLALSLALENKQKIKIKKKKRL